jgi:quinol monooxygenase YgiN
VIASAHFLLRHGCNSKSGGRLAPERLEADRDVIRTSRVETPSFGNRVGRKLDDPMIQACLRIVIPEPKRSEVLDVLRALRGPAEFSVGCRMCRVFQDVENGDGLTYLVQWDTRQDLEEHLRSERFRRLLPYIEMSMDPPEVEISDLDPLGGLELLVAVLGPKPG